MAAIPTTPESERPLTVLVVDDEEPLVELVAGYLAREGWRVLKAADGESAINQVREHAPNVVVLDVMLPGLDGIQACARIRTFSDAYVVMLTARGDELDRVVGLSVGADDYVVKPFSPRELVARIKAMTRRPRSGLVAAEPPCGLEIDESRRTVRVDGEPVDLTALEFDLLAELCKQPGTVKRRNFLLDRLWGNDYVADEHLVDVHVANLRRRLGDDADHPRFVETVRGVGYRVKTDH